MLVTPPCYSIYYKQQEKGKTMKKRYTIFGPMPFGVPCPPLTLRQRLAFLWCDIRIWTDERLHDGQPTTWRVIRGR